MLIKSMIELLVPWAMTFKYIKTTCNYVNIIKSIDIRDLLKWLTKHNNYEINYEIKIIIVNKIDLTFDRWKLIAHHLLCYERCHDYCCCLCCWQAINLTKKIKVLVAHFYITNTNSFQSNWLCFVRSNWSVFKWKEKNKH